MTEELQNKLYAKYPKIFAEKDLPMTQTCMNWGICCGDGWYWLIDQLCSSLQWRIDNPDKVKLQNGKWSERRRMIRICCIILKGAICNRCGYEFNGKNGAAFTFHHRNPEEKDFELSHNLKLSLLSEEIEKCDLVCERCHKLIHVGVIE